MLDINIHWIFYLLIIFPYINAFIPFSLLADGGQTANSITHTEITQSGFIRSLARYFYDTRIHPNNNTGGTVNEQEYFTTAHTIDELYKLAYPEYSQGEAELYSLPLKLVLDLIMTENALVDFNSHTKKLSAAHFDSEAFINGSRRILQLRQTIVNNVRDINKDLTNARQLLGQLCHTLQDFYSHSNWIEMGNTDINILIGLNEIIGSVAGPNQATCINSGCKRIEKDCSIWQRITLPTCPLVYYDCQNNILPEINNQKLLTSGYSIDQHNENNDPINKPTNISKCSHGSVFDSSSNIPAIGGINKDADSLIFSPHSNLHFQAVNLAIKATELFLNNLRRDIGDNNFDRLFSINPLQASVRTASNAVANGQRFRFFTPLLSDSLKENGNVFTNLKNWITKRTNMIKSILTSIFSSKKNIPTYDLSDLGVNVKDVNNFRAGPYILEGSSIGRKKRLINVLRKRQ